MEINRFSENYLLWANRTLFNSGNKVTIPTYIYQSWILVVCLFPCALLPVHVWSQSWRSTVALSPRSPFCPAEPWIPVSPFAPFFLSAPRGPWGPVFPGLPRSPLAPSRPGAPGAPGTHVMYVHIPVCPPLLQDGQDWTGCKKGENLMLVASFGQFWLLSRVSIQVRKCLLIFVNLQVVIWVS